MKTFNKILTLIAAGALFAAGCVNEDPAYKNKGEVDPPASGNGFLTLQGMNMRVILDTQTDTGNDDTGGETQRPTSARNTRTQPEVDEFIVEIFDAKDVSILKRTYGELKSELQDKKLELAVGSYRMEVRSDEEIPDVEWERPTYGGEQTFSILKGQTTTIDEVVCTLTNIKVTVMCSADLAARLNKDVTKATVSLGGTDVNFSIGETKAAYFRAQEEENTLGFLLTGKFTNDDNVRFTKTIEKVRAGQWRKITLVVTYADKGEVKFDIKVENFVQDSEVVVDGSEGAWESIYDEEPEIDPTAPTITWPDHDLSVPFTLKKSMFDANNNCLVPFIFDLKSPNGIDAFVVSISSDNAEFMTSLRSMQIPESFDLCTMTSDHPAYDLLHNDFGFPMGSEIKGQTVKKFDITKQMPMLYGFNGRHAFRLRMTDANSLTSEITLTIVVDKSTEGAPTIVWEGHDLSQVYTLVQDMNIRVNISASAGIKSLLVTIDAPALLPMLESLPELQEQFDLCTVSEDAAMFLKETVGFPTGNDVKNQTATHFEISSVFCNILKDLDPVEPGKPNTYDFRIEVIDNNNQSTKGVLQLKQ